MDEKALELSDVAVPETGMMGKTESLQPIFLIQSNRNIKAAYENLDGACLPCVQYNVA